jgi:hypothetical protein
LGSRACFGLGNERGSFLKATKVEDDETGADEPFDEIILHPSSR